MRKFILSIIQIIYEDSRKKYYTFKKITVILYKKREKFEIILCFYPFAMKRRDEFRK